MAHWLRKSRRFFTALGGLAAALSVGFWGGAWWSQQADDTLIFPPTALEAVATDSSDTFTLATGPVGAEAEGVFMLDQVTGELQCLVMGRQAPNGVARFVAQFKKNVYEDLQVVPGKKAKLLMVTGFASFIGSRGSTRLADGVVYVVDSTTGRFAAYGMPWNTTAYSAGRPQVAPFITMAVGSVRDAGQIRQ